MSPAEVLLRAADRVQFQGWCQGAYAIAADGCSTSPHSPDAKKWCAAGALTAEGMGIGAPAACSESDAALEALLSQIGTSISRWNDTPGRTADEVADTMRRVAKELENSVQ